MLWMRAGCIVCHVELFAMGDVTAAAAVAVATTDDDGDGNGDGDAVKTDALEWWCWGVFIDAVTVRSSFTCNSISS